MPVGLDEAYLNITEYLEERQNWPEDKRKYFYKTDNVTENGKQISMFINQNKYYKCFLLLQFGITHLELVYTLVCRCAFRE